MISGKSLAFILVLTSAFVHASWNVAARHLKGNFSVLILAHFIGAIMSIPLVIMYGDFENSLSSLQLWKYLLPTICFHGGYLFLLATAYFYGDVGLVYPLARGTSIVLATIASQAFSIGAPLNAVEYAGILCVLSGIFILSFDAYNNLTKSLPSSTVSNSNTESENAMDISSGIELGELKHAQPAYAPLSVQEDSNLSTSSAPLKEVYLEQSPASADSPSQSQTLETETRSKVSMSIALALCVGCCTACYSITDSYGVNHTPALTYSFMLNLLAASIYFPYIYYCKHEECVTAIQTQKKYLVIMGPATTGAYLIILFVFEIPDVNIALVVTLREFSVLIGTVLGVLLLGERYSKIKLAAVVFICIGMAILKLG